MSIAVMNWVWTKSPTSGNERLVLLALADACSQDDGGGCWPSAPTIARKAGISERTVWRVIARLEEAGQILLVHRGGGRTSNSYAVVMDIHSSGQTVTPDDLSGVTPGVRAGATQPRQGSPDTAVSPDPPSIHPVTAAARTREADTSHNTTKAAARNANGRKRKPAPADRQPDPDPEAEEFFTALGDAWRLSGPQRVRLTSAITAALKAGWSPGDLATFVGANTAGIRNPYAILAARLAPAELPDPPKRPPRRRPWCGKCDPDTRFEVDEHGYPGDSPKRCPDCSGPTDEHP